MPAPAAQLRTVAAEPGVRRCRVCSVFAQMSRYATVSAGTRRQQVLSGAAQSGTSWHVPALADTGKYDRAGKLTEQRTLNPRVRGSSPWRRTRTDLGIYKNQVIFSCPFCPHVCSMFARAHGPSNPGLVKNDPSGARCGGNRPGAAPSRTVGAVPGSLDQWSRPSRSGMRNALGVSFRCRHIQ